MKWVLLPFLLGTPWMDVDAAGADTVPFGWLDEVTREGQVRGWALDPDSPQVSLDIHIYVDGTPGACGSGCRVFAVRADQPRPDVNERVGYPGDHGYLYRLPDSLRDGQTVRAYALNAQSGGHNPELRGSPKVVQPAPQTRFGIFYLLWHCPFSKPPRLHDISRALRGEAPWGPVPEFHWWDEPQRGYYCLSADVAVLREHAVMLRDAGIDFVFLDVTNHAYSDSRSDRPREMILDPLDRLLETWSQVPGAPKVVPWVPIPGDGTMIDALLSRLGSHAGMHFQYLGKPLILVVDHSQGGLAPDESRLNQLRARYTVRKMWGLSFTSPSSWSFLSPCSPGFKRSGGSQACNQRVSRVNGRPEQISVTTAYQETYMSYAVTAVPKFRGKTFVKQFETIFKNPEVPIATLTGWNEWIAQRFCLDASGQATGNPGQCVTDQFPTGAKVFVDAYDVEYNRDIEPAKNEMGDYYYQLMKACISMFRQGQRCGPDSVPAPPPARVPVGWLDGVSPQGLVWGWAADPDTPAQSIQVHLYIDGAPGSCGPDCLGVPIQADRPRPDVNQRTEFKTGDHGYLYQLPEAFKKGGPHTLQAYGINTDGSGNNPQLLGSPKTFQFDPAQQSYTATASR